jgi:hypothetical protein
MKADVTEQLSEARDFYSLTRGVLALCEPFGPVHAFRLVHNRGASSVACLVELESAKQQPVLARTLGARVLNGAVCLEVPVHKDFGNQGKVVALASPAAGPELRLPQQPTARAATTQASIR